MAASTLSEQFASQFLGVAMQRSRTGDTTPVRVATTGVFEFDCLLAMFELGSLIAAFWTDHQILENQRVIEVAAVIIALGRVAKREPEPRESVLVDIRSTVMTGGV